MCRAHHPVWRESARGARVPQSVELAGANRGPCGLASVFNPAPRQRCGSAASAARPPPHTHTLPPTGARSPLPRSPAEANSAPSLPLPYSGASGREEAKGPPLVRTEDLLELRDGFYPYFYFIRECGRSPRPTFAQSEAAAARQPAHPSGPSSSQDALTPAKCFGKPQTSTALALHGRAPRARSYKSGGREVKSKQQNRRAALPQSTTDKLKEVNI